MKGGGGKGQAEQEVFSLTHLLVAASLHKHMAISSFNVSRSWGHGKKKMWFFLSDKYVWLRAPGEEASCLAVRSPSATDRAITTTSHNDL